ncbi:growth hormone secretagogue receptor type 1 isoform X4 [Prorops nasuta]|uniref:growth hormone secretagogue receptor type 1 isoform X4 n=1 Tax=Prorops nasuta TaxID=863751 RepID=UPI0034CFE882
MLSTMSSATLELNSSYYTTVIGSSTLDEFSVSVIESVNATSMPYMLPPYIRTTSMAVCIIVMILGIVGNLMVPLVVLRGKDMRNSTNIFLVNLSVADLCVLLICTPTVLVEVNSGPQVWRFGEHMCKAVPFVEYTVAHASVLTILAISFERYYAICKPFRAGYVCTKARATLLCFLSWIAAALCTSPMIWVSQYREIRVNGTFGPVGKASEMLLAQPWNQPGGPQEQREQSSGTIPVCVMQADTTATMIYFLLHFSFFYVAPLLMLVVLYSFIVRHLTMDTTNNRDNHYNRARKQVVLMLLAVVFSFFLCLSPFKLLSFFIIVAPAEQVDSINHDTFYNILYFSRVMFYLNSAVNPILYNLMSSKFRSGFLKLCPFPRPNVERSTLASTLSTARRLPVLKDDPDNFL